MTWEALRSIKNVNPMPWLVVGDFNEILYNNEKEGGRPRTQRQLQAFHDSLAECDLVDLGYVGDQYTWQRGKIRERLDLGVANMQWTNLFPMARLTNSEMTKSDHRPILLETEYLADTHGREGARRFEARWLREDTVEEIVKAAWARAALKGDNLSLMQKVGDVHEQLHTWDREVLKSPLKRMKDLKTELERVRRSPMTDANLSTHTEGASIAHRTPPRTGGDTLATTSACELAQEWGSKYRFFSAVCDA